VDGRYVTTPEIVIAIAQVAILGCAAIPHNQGEIYMRSKLLAVE
jgi:hypothetical protein